MFVSFPNIKRETKFKITRREMTSDQVMRRRKGIGERNVNVREKKVLIKINLIEMSDPIYLANVSKETEWMFATKMQDHTRPKFA